MATAFRNVILLCLAIGLAGCGDDSSSNGRSRSDGKSRSNGKSSSNGGPFAGGGNGSGKHPQGPLSPTETYKRSIQLTLDGKADELYDMYDNISKEYMDYIASQSGTTGREQFRTKRLPIMQRGARAFQKSEALARLEFSESINGDTAVVTKVARWPGVETTSRQNFTLVREDGIWKLYMPDARRVMANRKKRLDQEKKKADKRKEIAKNAKSIPQAGLIPNAGWKIQYISSQADKNPATFAIDGNPQTTWQTLYRPLRKQKKYPHILVIDLGRERTVRGFRYLTRQDGKWNGTLNSCEFYVSNDPGKFDKPTATATFKKTRESQEVTCAPTKGRYVGIRMLSGYDTRNGAVIAELGVLGE